MWLYPLADRCKTIKLPHIQQCRSPKTRSVAIGQKLASGDSSIYSGVWIRWNGTVEWNGGMDWTGMEWNDQSTNFVGVAKLCPRQFQYPWQRRTVLERVWSTIATVL